MRMRVRCWLVTGEQKVRLDKTDLNCSGSNPICHTGEFTSVFDRNQTDELCKLLINEGIQKIQFNCHYIIKQRERVQELIGHNDHIHFDGPDSNGHDPLLQGRSTSCGNCNIWNDKCPDRIYKVYDDNYGWRDYDNTTKYAAGRSRGNGAAALFQGNNKLRCLTIKEWEAMNNNNKENAEV
ncbi:hypothetical protein QA601_18270 [Chitinispirillales bacterium ANBcel5]|uniref:hypothetical protein n=1 Tax=Cellulosispirillum alkaliphilum TaxID=3039283 RepID=UPI002A5398E9|nr:hypothetical protein [Chitinispirillales bacterium ANBcel5]